MPPLDSCYRRAARASRYIQEAQDLLAAVARECEENVIVNPDGTLFFNHVPDIPIDLPLAISDAVHNLRSGLNYLVYQLSYLDSGTFQRQTQWPIEDVKSGVSSHGNKIGFDNVVDRYLNSS